MVGRLTSRTPLAQGAHGFRVRFVLLAVVAAVIAIFAIPASANAAMGVTGFTVAPDTTVKGGNPNVTASFTRTGTANDDLRDAALHLPNGLTYSIAGVTTKCSTTQFQYDACPSNSIVGTTTANATLTLLGVIKFNGTMYGTMYARSNGQLGTIYRPSGFPKVVFSSSLYTSTLTGGVQIKQQNWPRTMNFLGVIPLEVTVGTVRTRYQARSGSSGTGQVVIQNPTTCGPALSRLVLTPYTGANVNASSTYNVTGCTATDTTPPTVTGISPATGTTTVASSIVLTYTAADDSGVAPTCTPASGSTIPLSLGSNTVVISCSDGSGNTTNVPLSYTRADTAAPVISGISPADGFSTTDSSVVLTYTATDNSGVAPSCIPASGSTIPLSVGVTPVDITCTDGSGNSVTQTVTYTRTVPDTTPPVISITSPADGSTTTDATTTLVYTASDDSGAAPSCSPASGSSVALSVGANTLSVTCSDGAGNSATESVSVTRVDATGPSISISSPVDGSTTTSATTTLVYTASDNSGDAPSCSPASGSSQALSFGSNTISVTCTDASSNSTTESVSVTRLDNTGPSISITSPVDGSSTTDASTTLVYTASDDSGDAPSCSPASGSSQALSFGSNTISVTCTDASSNSTTESVSVTRIDDEAPVITITSPIDGSSTTAASTTVEYTATDNSGAAPSCSPADGSSFALSVGSNTIAVTCTDASSNSSTESVTVTRLDNEAPSISITSPIDNSSTTDASTTLTYTASDNSGAAPSCSPASGTVVPLSFGSNTISVTCTDASSNSTTESVTVNRNDAGGPSITITSPVDGSSTTAASTTLVYTATDDSGDPPSCSPASGSSQPLSFGSNTISVTCTDGSSNSTTESVTVTRLDDEAPAISITSPVDGSTTTTATTTLEYTATDNSGDSPSCSPASGTVVPLAIGGNTISVTCTDDSSNSTTESVSVTRVDNEAPAISITSPVDGSSTTDASVTLSYTATDNSGAAPSCSPASGTAVPLSFGPNTISVTCTDASSNSTTESVSVTRLDNEAPVITITSPVDGSSTTDASVTLTYTAVDNSGDAPSCSPASGSSVALSFGSNTISVTCTDGSSNSRTEQVTVTRLDNVAPVITITSPVDGSSTTDASVTLSYTATDNSGDAPSCSPASGSSQALSFGSNTISVTCTDGSSNSSTESVSVTRLDNVAPTISITSPVDGSTTADATTTLSYTAADNSGDAPSCSPASGTVVPLSFGGNTISVTCTDASSNSTTESVSVTRIDNEAPAISITSPVDGSSTTDASVTLSYTATDNSGAAPSCGPPSGSSMPLSFGSNTISVTCTDPTGNMRTESVTVTRLDNVAPVITITGPVDGSSTTAASVTLSYTATDNSGDAPSCTPASGSSVALVFGSNTISVTCTDGSSNSSTESVSVTRLDNVAPSISISSPVDGSTTTDATTTLAYTATDNSGVAPSCTPATGVIIPLSFGVNTISVTCTDGSSNSTTESVTVTRNDVDGPEITITSPVDGSSTTDASVTLSYTATDNSGAAPSCSPASGSSVALDFGSNTISVTCTDGSSNSTTESVTVTRLDNVAPVITITSPVDGSSTTDASVVVAYTATDNSGVAPSCTPASGSSFALSIGSNTIAVTCTDGSSNSTTESVTVTRLDNIAPTISITSPLDGSSTADSSVTLTYTAADNSGVAPSCTPASGSSQALSLGSNTISVTCTDGSSNSTTESVTVTRLDVEAPSITITSPVDGSSTTDASVTLSYTATDNSGAAPSCSPTSGSSQPLSFGSNTISVTCTDASSNSRTESVTVTRLDDEDPVISNISPIDGFETGDESVVLTYDVTDNSGNTPVCSPASGSTIPLAVGPNSVTIECDDGNGNVGSVTVVYTRVVVEPVPNTVIDQYAPASAQTSSLADVASSSDVPTATFECRMNGEAFAACPSIWTLPLSSDPSIALGVNTYDIRAVSSAGPDPTPARGYIWVDDRPFYATATVTPEPNSLVADSDAANDAGAHPDVSANLVVEGYDDPQSVTIQFPDGLMGSLKAVPEANRCVLADAESGNCPASAAIGTVTGTAVGPVDGEVTATGTVYLVGPAGLDPQYAAGVAVDFENIIGPVSGNVGDIYATAGLRLNDQARNLVIDIPSIPNVTYANTSSPGGMPFHITEVDLTVHGDTGGAANPLITNPHFCNDGAELFDARPNFQNFVGSGLGYFGGATGDITVPYVVDNCASVPFNPSLDLSLTEPTAGSSTGINATVTLPSENSTLRGVQVRLPSFMALNFPSFGVASDMCSGNDDGSGAANNVSPEGTFPAYYSFDASTCPPQAQVGTAILTTPLLDDPVTGYVYLIDKTPVPWLGISVTPDIPGNPQGVNIGLVGFNATPQEDPGCVSGCQLIVQSTFSSAPDVPVSSIALALGGITGRISDGPGNPELNPNILNIASANSDSCRNSGTSATAEFNPWTGTGIGTVSAPLTISGCNDPKVRVTSPTPPTTGSRINNVSNTTATSPLNFTVNGSTTIPVGVTCDINGTPTASTTNTVPLVTGVNEFLITCTDAFGAGTATRRIDKGIPSIRFVAPTASSTTAASVSSTIAVNANGALLSGTLPGSSGTTCNINGINVSSLSTAVSVPLVLGPNTLTATCTNAFGTGTTTTSITRN